MTKIYTKTGDNGQTSLFGGNRVSKADSRIAAIGDVDELNAWIGLLRDFSESDSRRMLMKEIQEVLFEIGAELANSTKTAMPHERLEHQTAQLESEIDAMTLELPPLRHFILPGGHPQVSYAHLTRTVCRRAERALVNLNAKTVIQPALLIYLNRLSDYLFVLARKIGHELGAEEQKWQK